MCTTNWSMCIQICVLANLGNAGQVVVINRGPFIIMIRIQYSFCHSCNIPRWVKGQAGRGWSWTQEACAEMFLLRLLLLVRWSALRGWLLLEVEFNIPTTSPLSSIVLENLIYMSVERNTAFRSQSRRCWTDLMITLARAEPS